MSAEGPAPATTGAKGAVQTVEPTRAQRTVARRMAESKATVPDFQATVEVDVTELLAARGTVTVTAAVVRAAGVALREHRSVNGAYADGKYQHYQRANVGVVVGGGEALVIPTIFDADADATPATAISEQLAALVAEVRDGTITASALSGATFTVSNLGMHGVRAFTAIIQPGQAATLAVGAATERIGLREGAVVARQVLTLTLSADQRIVSGTDAASFLARVRALLEDPAALLG